VAFSHTLRFEHIGDEHKSVEEYREEIGQLFEQRTDPTVCIAIDFSRFFEIAEQYRDRGRYLAAATAYRALFEAVNENWNWIDGAYDHDVQAIPMFFPILYCFTVNSPVTHEYSCLLPTHRSRNTPPFPLLFDCQQA
jgi:hypothetical protein